MDKLKALVASKRKATEEEFKGRKFVKRSELEEARLAKLREEEEQERAAKRPKSTEPAPAEAPAAPAASPPVDLPPPEQVIRQLRALGQPVTLFGETEAARHARMLLALSNVAAEEEADGGQQANLHIELQREEKQKQKEKAAGMGAAEPAAAAEPAEPENPETAALMASFRAAAEAVAERNLPVEDRITKALQRWMADWEEELAARDATVADSAAGRQAEVRFKETQRYLRPLYARLKGRSLDAQLLAGIKLMVDAMRERNYLHAYKIYMGVAIGNAPWPIGVTQVGLHERSAREKIGFKAGQGSAHIMNDEATRKFIQALKRLMTYVQRRYPTDPSRSVDFDGHAAPDGAGDKVALLQAVARGEEVAPAPAPSMLDERGRVKIPEKWDQVLRGALQEVAADDAEAAKRQPK